MMFESEDIDALLSALRPFALMDRADDIHMDEVACERGTASDKDIITSRDFRRANILYNNLLNLRTRNED